MSNTPQIRFAGFTDAWEQRKLGDIGETYTGLSGKTKEDFGHGNAAFVTYMNVFSNPIADSAMTESVEIDKKQNEVKYGDVFFTTSSETPDEVGMSSVWLENGENTYLNSFCFGYRPSVEINPFYMAYMLRSDSVRKNIVFLAQGISRYNISKNKMMEISVPSPTLEEQRKIGEYFRNLDTLITLHQRKCDALQRFKKAMLQKMFPKNGESVPEIRFAGFTDAWEQRKLSDLIEENQKPVPKPDGEYIRLGIRSHAKGTFHEVVAAGEGLDVDTMYVVEANNLIVNITFAWEEAWAITSEKDAEKLVSHRFPQYRFHHDQYPMFYQYRFRNGRMKYNLELASPGGAGRNRVLNKTEFMKIPVTIPTSYEEEKKIGDLFANLDNLITLHQRKLETLQKMKKSLLQKMFV